jgi:hypothetical protein
LIKIVLKKWINAGMDYMSNCVFIDGVAFHINMKRFFVWSEVGTRTVVKVPKTRAKTTTILGATSPYGLVNIKVRRPQVVPAPKKRKTAESSRPPPKVKHFYRPLFQFLSNTMDVIVKFPNEPKDHYLVMDNAFIHKNEEIKSFVEGCGYR